MTRIQKSDFKKLLSPQHRTRRLLWPPPNEPGETCSSADEKASIEAKAVSFAQDFIWEHSSSRAAAAPAHHVAAPLRAHASAASKSAPA